MNCIHLSEREMIQIKLEKMIFCGEIMKVETGGDGMKGSIIFQPPDRYYELLRMLFDLQKLEEPRDIFVI